MKPTATLLTAKARPTPAHGIQLVDPSLSSDAPCFWASWFSGGDPSAGGGATHVAQTATLGLDEEVVGSGTETWDEVVEEEVEVVVEVEVVGVVLVVFVVVEVGVLVSGGTRVLGLIAMPEIVEASSGSPNGERLVGGAKADVEGSGKCTYRNAASRNTPIPMTQSHPRVRISIFFTHLR